METTKRFTEWLAIVGGSVVASSYWWLPILEEFIRDTAAVAGMIYAVTGTYYLIKKNRSEE